MKPYLVITSIFLIAATPNIGAHEGGHTEERSDDTKLIIEPRVYLNAVVGDSDLKESGLAHGRYDPSRNGFSIANLALSTDFQYGEYLAGRFQGSAFWNEDDGWDEKVEELYIKGLNLPGGLELKLGRFLPAVGNHNNVHNRAWNYVDNQLGNIRLLGKGGLILEGGELNWSPTTPWDDRLTASLGDTINHGYEEAEESLWDKNILVLHYGSTFWTNHQNSYLIGVSYVQGENFFNETTRLYGLDATYSWFQNDDLGKRLIWANEVMFREVATDEEKFEELAFSSMVNYHFNEDWEVGLRYDYLEGVADPELPERHRISPAVTHRRNLADIQSSIRLQYNYDHSEEQKEDHSIWLQFGFEWGYGGSSHTH